MDQAALKPLLHTLIAQWESEVVEFKEASNDYDTDKIGRYFSGLSNEANLLGLEKAWLIFGVRNADRTIVGTNYRPEPERLQSLKHQIATNLKAKGQIHNAGSRTAAKWQIAEDEDTTL